MVVHVAAWICMPGARAVGLGVGAIVSLIISCDE
jgi:hypothetical protein